MAKKDKKDAKPKVNPALNGLEININEFGEIESNFDREKLIKFLNKTVEDKKLKDRKDISDEGEFLNTSSEEIEEFKDEEATDEEE